MEFTTRDDIEAPIEYVFDQVTDFAALERSIMRRGGDVARIAGGKDPAVGVKWRVQFRFRGKERSAEAEITAIDRPNGLTIVVGSQNIDGQMVVELVALSRARTRMITKVDVSAKTIPAKLLFQSLRFARHRTDGRYKTFVSGFAKDIDTRYRSKR